MNRNLLFFLIAGLAVVVVLALAFLASMPNQSVVNNSEFNTVPEVKFEGTKLEGAHPTRVSGYITLDDPEFELENRNCTFTVHPSDLDSKFSARMSERIREAANLDISDLNSDVVSSVDVSGGGWFASESGVEGIDPAEAIQLVEEFNFTFQEDMLETRIRDNGDVIFESRWYSCNMKFNDRIYDITLILSVPTEVRDTDEITRVIVTPESLEQRSIINHDIESVYDPFNNTAIWVNKLDSWITVNVNYTNVAIEGSKGPNQNGSDAKKIPPGGLLDIDLSPNWYTEPLSGASKMGDRIYSYRVVEYPWISDSFAVSTRYSHKETTSCYSMAEAKSLYSQSKLDIRFPSYIPEGYSPVCYMTGGASWFIQVYSTHSKFVGSPNDSFLIGVQPKGIITIHTAEDSVLGNSTAHGRYQNMIANSIIPADAKFFVVDGKSVIAYVEGDVASVSIHQDDSTYHHLKGRVTVGDLTRMAESLS